MIFNQDNQKLIFEKFEWICSKEQEISEHDWTPVSTKVFYNIVFELFEIAYSSLVLRSYNTRYGITCYSSAFESVAAHTNLMIAIIDRIWDLVYKGFVNHDGFSYREVTEVARRHDLPENIIGDIPDNGERNETDKLVFEKKYFHSFSNMAMDSIQEGTRRRFRFRFLSEENVSMLLTDLERRKTETGRLIYSADKASALIMTLCYDYCGLSPMMSKDDPKASLRDLEEMEMCDYTENNRYRASEMWAIDYFEKRHINQYDDYGVFSRLIIMATLVVNYRWYHWREKCYL